MDDREAIQRPEERPFVFQRPDDVHYSAEALLKVRHLYVVGRSDFTAPSDEPLPSALADSDAVAPVQDLEAYPTDRVPARSLGPRQRDTEERAQVEEAEDCFSAGRSRGIELIVISDEKMPRLSSVTREILCKSAHCNS